MRKPTAAFVGAGYAALALFSATYLVCLWRMDVPPVEGFFYILALLFGLVGTIVLTKAIRDREDNIPVTGAFIGIGWVAVIAPLFMMGLYLLNVSALDELQRGMLFLTYMASVFAMVVVQKSFRDIADYNAYARRVEAE